VQDVLAQAKRSLHHDGIEKGGLLEGKLTPTSLRPKVSHHNLCESIGAKASMLIWKWDLSSLWGLFLKKSCKKSMQGASSGKGTPETSNTGTPITALISCGSICICCPLTMVCIMSLLSSS